MLTFLHSSCAISSSSFFRLSTLCIFSLASFSCSAQRLNHGLINYVDNRSICLLFFYGIILPSALQVT